MQLLERLAALAMAKPEPVQTEPRPLLKPVHHTLSSDVCVIKMQFFLCNVGYEAFGRWLEEPVESYITAKTHFFFMTF